MAAKNQTGFMLLSLYEKGVRIRAMVFSATFNNSSVISWWSVFLMAENGGPGENHRPAASHLKRYHIALYRLHVHRHDRN